MKKKLKIKALDVILWFYITGFIVLCISMPWIRQRLPQRTPSPTPTVVPSAVPTNTPVPTLLPTSTPEPSPTATSTMIIVPVTEPEVIINSVASKEKEFIEFIYDEFYEEVIRVSHDTVTFYLGRKGNQWILIDYCFG